MEKLIYPKILREGFGSDVIKSGVCTCVCMLCAPHAATECIHFTCLFLGGIVLLQQLTLNLKAVKL